MRQPVKIRDAQEQDLEVIVRFNQALAIESEGKRLDDAVIRAGVRRALRSPELCRYFLAEVDGQVVGQTMITYELTDWRDGLVYWIQSVYVEENFRGQGIFRALFEHVHKLAKQRKEVCGLRLYMDSANATARKTSGVASLFGRSCAVPALRRRICRPGTRTIHPASAGGWTPGALSRRRR